MKEITKTQTQLSNIDLQSFNNLMLMRDRINESIGSNQVVVIERELIMNNNSENSLTELRNQAIETTNISEVKVSYASSIGADFLYHSIAFSSSVVVSCFIISILYQRYPICIIRVVPFTFQPYTMDFLKIIRKFIIWALRKI